MAWKEKKRMGRLFTAQRIAEEVFHGTKTPRWVRRHVPGCIKLKSCWGVSRYWREDDVKEWAKEYKAAA